MAMAMVKAMMMAMMMATAVGDVRRVRVMGDGRYILMAVGAAPSHRP
jgi:hypothetical protein